MLTLAGFEIRKNAPPAIITSGTGSGDVSIRSEIALVDGVIEFAQDGANPAIDNTTFKGTSLTNVYFKNASTIMKSGLGTAAKVISTTPSGFSRVADYTIQNDDFTDGIVYDGSIQNVATVGGVVEQNQNPTTDQFLKSHIWKHDNLSFDHWYALSKSSAQSKVCNALSSSAIKGNGLFDDTAGLRNMINDVNCKVIILPKGNYMVSGTLELKEETRLIGLNVSMTTLETLGNVWNPTSITPVIKTVDSPTATTSVEDI